MGMKRKSFTLLFKREALIELNDNCGNVLKITSELSFHQKMIHDWRAKSTAIFPGVYDRRNRRLGARLNPELSDIEKNSLTVLREVKEIV